MVLTVPSSSAFTWVFVVGAGLAGLLAVIGLLLENYRFEDRANAPAISPEPGVGRPAE